MRMRWVGLFGLAVLGSSLSWASEPSCYRTAAEAAAQSGVRGQQGFRLETVHREIFSGTNWATVRSCAHPEWPAALVMLPAWTSSALPRRGPSTVAATGRALLMLAGTRIRLVETSEAARVEMSGVAQTSAALGESVRVRLLPVSVEPGADGGGSWAASERFATGVVRSRDLVEVTAP